MGAIATEEALDETPAEARRLEPHVIVLFGATGDLAARKLLPGLLHLSTSGLMPDYRIVGSSTKDLSDEDFRNIAREACDRFATKKVSLLQWANFEQRLSFVSTAAGPEAMSGAVGRSGGRNGRRRAAPALPEHPARRPSAWSCNCWPRPSWSSARGSSWRSRSAPTWPAPSS